MLQKIVNIFRKSNRTGFAQALGKKEVQEDSFFISEKIGGIQLVLVADGVGGHGNGDFASQTVVKVFKNSWIEEVEALTTFNIPEFLKKKAVLAAATLLNEIAQNTEKQNCGSTLTGFIIVKNQFFTLNIGDSRVYKYSEGKLTRLTKDHSEIQRLIDTGILTEEQAALHPRRTIMTSAIGQPLEMIQIDISDIQQLQKEDLLLAFSDGVFDTITDAEIKTVIEENIEKSNLAERIVEAAIRANATDNVTCCFYQNK